MRIEASSPSPAKGHRQACTALAVVAAALIFMAISAAIAYPGWERAFRSDASPVAWLSSALLLTLSVVALRLVADGSLPLMHGIGLAAAFFGLALDEQFMLHEWWKYRCHHLTDLCRHSWVRELPMLLIAVFGTLSALCLHRVLPTRPVRILLWSGISVGLFAIGVDQFETPYPVNALEEAFEVIAESLVLAALMSTHHPA